MPDVEDNKERLRLGDLVVDLAAQRVWRGREEILLPNLSFDLLECLIRHAPGLVETDRLMDEVWTGVVVSPETVSKRVNLLRNSLAAGSDGREYVALVRGRGYRLAQPVTRIAGTPRRLRQVGAAVAVLLAIVIGISRLQPGSTTDPSVAVLPFTNMSGDPRDELFIDGVHQDLITRLVKVGTLKVISRNSTARYVDTGLTRVEIANELGVSTILEGGIQRAAGQVRINAALIDAATDETLWADSYDRQLTAENLFAIQSEISQQIVTALHIRLTSEEDRQLRTVPTVNLDAYREYVLGHEHMLQRTAESLLKAQEHFETAIRTDPRFALAYTGLADALALRTAYADLGIRNSIEPRQAAIDKALKLDPSAGEAYTSLAALRRQQADFEAAERYFRQAIELSPNYSTAHQWYATAYLLPEGRYEEALYHIRTAIDLDPHALVLKASLAHTLLRLGRMEEAAAVLSRAIESDPHFSPHYVAMAQLKLARGRIGEALAWHRKGVKFSGHEGHDSVNECLLFLGLGDDLTAETCIEKQQDSNSRSAGIARVELHTYRREFDEAVADAIKLDESYPSSFNRFRLARSHFNNGDFATAEKIYRELVPELFGDEDIDVRIDGIEHVVVVARLHAVSGRVDRADYLYSRALEAMRSMHRVRGADIGIWDVFVHVARGDKERAIAALRDAIKAGWRDEWWQLRWPIYESMRDVPEWNALIDDLAADIARQRAWYEAHDADAPK